MSIKYFEQDRIFKLDANNTTYMIAVIQVEMYHKYNDLVRTGDYYRIENYSDNNEFDSWEIVSKDKSEALVTCIQILGKPNYRGRKIKLKGLEEESLYKDEETRQVYSGGALMNAGIIVDDLHGDFAGKIIHYIKIDEN